jgi:hypothetical protein
MNMRQRLLAGATVMLLASSPVWAVTGTISPLLPIRQAPEIDAASGTSAIALLTGVVLLMKERRRSKRSSKSDKSDV